MEKLIKVAVNDFRLVFRDNSLKFFLVLPLLNLLVIRYGLPYVAGIFEVLNQYIPLIVMMITMQGSLAFGFIYSMVLIDEKDTNVNKVYGVLPISKFWFVIFRLVAPFLLSTFSTFLLLLADPFYGLPLFSSLLYSALAGLVAPVMILFVAIMSKNKIEGMTWQKLFNLPVSLPILAFIIPASYSFIFAILPTYWAFLSLDNLIRGESILVFISIGFAQILLLIGFLCFKFTKIHFS